MNWQALWAYVKARLVEKSTWTAIIGALVAAGAFTLTPDKADQVSGLVALVLASVLAVTPTKQ
jgi:hypothetical protein